MASQWTTINVDGRDTWAYLSLPDVPGPNPGVVVIQHGSGVDDFTQTMTRRLSEAGYAAIAQASIPGRTPIRATRLAGLEGSEIATSSRMLTSPSNISAGILRCEATGSGSQDSVWAGE